VVSIGNRQFNLLDAHFQRVARLRFLNEDRAVQDVSSGTLVGDLLINIAEVLLHLVGGHSGAFQASWAVGDERVKHYGVAGMNVQSRRGGGIVVAPSHGLRRRGQRVFLRTGGGGRRLRRSLGNSLHKRKTKKRGQDFVTHRGLHLR